MSNHIRFAELLESHLAGIISPDETQELLRLVKTGAYDDILKQSIDTNLFDGETTALMNEIRAEEILRGILQTENPVAKLVPMASTLKKYVRFTAVAASVIIVLITGWWLMQPGSRQKGLALKDNPKTIVPVGVAGGKKYIRLEDGSTVLLNEGSRLDYPEVFQGDLREVTLVGEAYFDIQHDAKRPFIVHTGKVNTIVLGTAFNIKAYPTQKEIIVTVTRGKVKVEDSGKTYGIISPNESIAVNTASNTHKQEKVNAENIVEWKKTYLVLDDVSLEEAATLINSRYHVNITFSTESLKQCRISASFVDNENLEQVLTVLTGVVNAAFRMQPNDQVIISGEGCQ